MGAKKAKASKPLSETLAAEYPHLDNEAGWPTPAAKRPPGGLNPFVVAQAQYWWDAKGKRHSLAKMRFSHLRALQPFLNNHAEFFWRKYQACEEGEPSSELPLDRMPSTSDFPDMKWIKETPLYRAIGAVEEEKLASLVACGDCGKESSFTYGQVIDSKQATIKGWETMGSLNNASLRCPDCIEKRRPKAGEGIKKVANSKQLLY